MCFLHSVKWEKREGARQGGGWCLRDQWEVKGYLMQHTISKGLRINKNRGKKVKKRLALEIQAEFPCFWKKPLKYLCVFWRWMLRLVFSKVDFPCKSRSGSFWGVFEEWCDFSMVVFFIFVILFAPLFCDFVFFLFFISFLSLACSLF